MSSIFPNETLFAIFENLPPTALVQVTCVSNRFRAIAERILYSNIVIYEGLSLSNSRPYPYKTLRCCETLLRYADLCEVVRRFHIRWQTDDGPRQQFIPFVEPSLVKLNQVLRRLGQLEVLELAFGLIGAQISAQSILQGCSFPSMHTFAMCGIGRGSIPAKYQPYTASIDSFLAVTPSIHHLRLSDHYDPIRIRSLALPALSIFRGTAVTAASILPGRSVQSLALVGQDHIERELLAHISRGSTPIRRLDLSGISVTPTLLRDISQHLSRVVYLKVRFAFRHTLHHSFTGISILAGLTPVLGAFSQLYQLDLSPTPVSNMGLGNSLEESSLCTTWARSCTSLRQVIFPSKTEWSLSPEQIWVPHSTPRYTRS
ncbi:uncharacterized protein LAESUDRAFT_724891 [Laetiporus sulphureus 93-53]|uniref:F-box domain-containing protein n=1 Tax=Laetiporus sulphureus 93-53 TaxID=1314785 RepID=A0A165ENB0_9APHY|nr:uncharacterized protein LAESUDRAFT_724891 [Laetiporus sulphureus 93-53]KZT07422.1 hypothetical protein LAESUDRAFT_724891 [Laetiporus sulphureus 93-53]